MHLSYVCHSDGQFWTFPWNRSCTITSRFPVWFMQTSTSIVDWQRDIDSMRRTKRGYRSCIGSCKSTMLMCCRKWIELGSRTAHSYWRPCQTQLWNRLPGIRLSHKHNQVSNAVLDCKWWMSPFASTEKRNKIYQKFTFPGLFLFLFYH